MATYSPPAPHNDGGESPAPPSTQITSSAINSAAHRRLLVDRLIGTPPAICGISASARTQLYQLADNPHLSPAHASRLASASKGAAAGSATHENAAFSSSYASKQFGEPAHAPGGFVGWLATLPLLRDLPLPCLSHNGDLGGPTLGFWSSMVLLVNNITGPGMLALPLAFSRGGVLLTVMALLFYAIIGGAAAIFAAAAISRVPPHIRAAHGGRLEFCPLVSHYLNGRYELPTQLLYHFSLQVKTIASIIVSAQVMDKLCVWATGSVHALQLSPSLSIVSDTAANMIPFESAGPILISSGYIISAVFFLPLGFFNMDENIIFQWGAAIIMAGVLAMFGVHFSAADMAAADLPWGVGPSVMVSIGIVMFCFTFTDTVPSWYNEKKPSVPTAKTLSYATGISTAIYIFMGLLGALAYPAIQTGNVLELLADKRSSLLVQLSTYLFSLSTIGLGIPIFCIIMRYNLYVGRVTSAGWARFWGALFPWLVSFILYQGTGYVRFVNWSSLLVTSLTNFVLPAYIYLIAVRRYPEPGALVARDSAAAEAEDAGESGDEFIVIGRVGRKGKGKKGRRGGVRRGLAESAVQDDDDLALMEAGLPRADEDVGMPSFASLLDGPVSTGAATAAVEKGKGKKSSTTGAGAVGADKSVATSSSSNSGLDMSLYDAGALGLMAPEPAAAAATGASISARTGSVPEPVNGSASAASAAAGIDEEGVVQLPGPAWFHKTFPTFAPLTVMWAAGLATAAAVAVDVYYLVVHGEDLTDIA